MIGRLKDLSVNRDGSQTITVTVKEDFRETFDELKDKEVKVEIKRYYRRRSLEANAYAWALIDQISEKTGIRKSEVYRQAILDIGGVSTLVDMIDEAVPVFKASWEKNGMGNQIEATPDTERPGWSNVRVYFGSSTYDTHQMSRFIDSLIQEAESQGIQTIPKDKVEKMLEAWGKKKAV